MTDHVDYFNQPLEIGDYVVSAYKIANEPLIAIYQIESFEYIRYHRDINSKKTERIVMLSLQRIGSKTKKKSTRQADNVIRIDPALMTYKKLLDTHDNKS